MFWQSLLQAVAASTSFLASASLFILVCRLSKPKRSTLLARQLWQLSLADMLGYSCFAFWPTYRLFPTMHFTDSVCTVVFTAYIPILVSAFVDTHIALTMLASVFRWQRLLDTLCYWLVIVWPMGIVMGVVALFAADPEADLNPLASCYYAPFGIFIREGTVLFSLLISVCSYLCSGFKVARTSGDAVLRRLTSRARWFVLASVLTFAPFCIFTIGVQMTGDARTCPFTQVCSWSSHMLMTLLVYLGMPLFSLGGVMNMIVYVILSRHTQDMLRWQSITNRGFSLRDPVFPVGFTEDAHMGQESLFEDDASVDSDRSLAQVPTYNEQ